MESSIKRLFGVFLALSFMLAAFSACGHPGANVAPGPIITSNIQVTEGSKNTPNPAQNSPEPTASPTTVKESTRYNNYNIVADVNPETRTVTGIEKVSYKNRTGMELSQIYFNLHLNAFKRTAATKPYTDSTESGIFPFGKDYGYINITDTMINNAGAVFNVKDTVLTITFPEPLPPDAETEITIVFEAYIPAINHRTGSNESAMWMGNFFPILALYDENGWHKGPYYPVGDPFYANIANYAVKITTPAAYTVVGTGEEVSSVLGGVRTTDISAMLVRDFAFAVSQLYQVDTMKTNSGVYVNLYHYSETSDGDAILNLAVKALEAYSAHVGSYPYASLDLIEVGIIPVISGMEYPGVAFIDASYFASEAKLQSIPLKLGHQWFYNIIGNNQIKEAWLDEGLTEYVCDRLFLTAEESALHMSAAYDSLQAALPTIENKTLLQDLSVYKTWSEYLNIQRTRAKLMMYALEQEIGTESMEAFLKLYYSKYAFRLVNKNEFIATAEEASQMELDDFFRGWMEDFALPPLDFPTQLIHDPQI